MKQHRFLEYQEDIYKENASKKRRIKTDEQYREYQVWHVGVQEELDVKRKDTADIEDVDTEVYRKEDVSAADQYSDIEKEQADLYVVKSREMDDGDAEQIYTSKNVAIDDEIPAIPMDADKVEWIAERLSACGAYEEINAAVKADIFVLDIADVSGSIRLFSDVMKRLGIKLDGDELYEEFQRIYDESVDRDAGKDKAEDKMWNRGRGR